jgi:hypothetical protein
VSKTRQSLEAAGSAEFSKLGFYFGMLSEHFQVRGFGVESDFGVGSVAEGLVARAAASAQGAEDFAVQVD